MINVPREIVKSYIYQHFQKAKSIKAGREIQAICVLCGDSKKHPGRKKRFNYNIFSNRWQCFNCGRAGHDFLSLVSEVEKIPYAQAARKFKRYFLDNIEEYFNGNQKESPPEKEEEFSIQKFLEEDCHPVSHKSKSLMAQGLRERAIKEIEKRGISLSSYNFFYCYKGPWKSRLIIPFYDAKGYYYFQGRSLLKNLEPKYKNAPTEKQSAILFGDDIHPELDIFIFEGFWEALIVHQKLNLNATSMLGKFIGKKFIEKVLELTEKNVIICFDNDKEGYDALKDSLPNLKKYRNRLRFFIWPEDIEEKDLCELWTKQDETYLKNFLEMNHFDYYQTSIKLYK